MHALQSPAGVDQRVVTREIDGRDRTGEVLLHVTAQERDRPLLVVHGKARRGRSQPMAGSPRAPCAGRRGNRRWQPLETWKPAGVPLETQQETLSLAKLCHPATRRSNLLKRNHFLRACHSFAQRWRVLRPCWLAGPRLRLDRTGVNAGEQGVPSEACFRTPTQSARRTNSTLQGNPPRTDLFSLHAWASTKQSVTTRRKIGRSSLPRPSRLNRHGRCPRERCGSVSCSLYFWPMYWLSTGAFGSSGRR